MMNESRCGLLCQQCHYSEQVGCLGCVAISKPFWGENCPIKSCCEDKKQEHCGQCRQFPCALLQQFAYDPQQGDNGARIKQCQYWREQQ